MPWIIFAWSARTNTPFSRRRWSCALCHFWRWCLPFETQHHETLLWIRLHWMPTDLQLSPFRARRAVENAFGILSSRFRIFRRAIDLEPAKVDKVILAIGLSTISWEANAKEATQKKDQLIETDQLGFEPGDWRTELPALENIPQQGGNSRTAKKIRSEFEGYFKSEGALYWQWERINGKS